PLVVVNCVSSFFLFFFFSYHKQLLFTNSTAHSFTILCTPLYSSCSLPVCTIRCNCSYHCSPNIYSPLGLSTRLLLYSYTRISIVYL
ncbi:hypothetical protein BDF22DRAFT_710205, partial [Syncephalis plumigaleata]